LCRGAYGAVSEIDGRTERMNEGMISTLIGGGIAIVSSIFVFLAQNVINRAGKQKVYAKIVGSKSEDGSTWGWHGESFHVPLWIELLNTTNVPHIVRNFRLYLYQGEKEVGAMIQINARGKIKYYYANDGAYSFVAMPRSIKKYDLHFVINKSELTDSSFDEIVVSFYDTNDKRRLFHLIDVDDCQSHKKREIDKDWRPLHKTRKARRLTLRH
jgi:hypothetical protein